MVIRKLPQIENPTHSNNREHNEPQSAHSMGHESIESNHSAENIVLEMEETSLVTERHFNLRSIATAVRLLTQDQRNRGWNEDSLENLGELYNEAVKYEKAHKKCREMNNRYHNWINVPFLILQSLLTLFIAVAGGGNIASLSQDNYYYSEFLLTILITCLSILNKHFHNDVNAEKHHNKSRQYFTLSQKVRKRIDTRAEHHEYDQVYNKFRDRFIEARRDSISLFPRVRKKYKIDIIE
jgi:hypothetical protein